MPKSHDVVPAEPFVRWLRARHEKLCEDYVPGRGDNGPSKRLAAEIGTNVRTLNDWMNSRACRTTKNPKGRHTDYLDRSSVEEALFRAGVLMWELYPDLDPDEPALERFYCTTCKEDVLVNRSFYCLWCGRRALLLTAETLARAEAQIEKGYSVPHVARVLWRDTSYTRWESLRDMLRRRPKVPA